MTLRPPARSSKPQARRIRIDFEYIGSRYCGWQWQDNAMSIQRVAEEALGKILQTHVRITASGRTDAGVHARMQPTHADVKTRISDADLMRAMNSVLPDDIGALDVVTVPSDWHARFCAREKTYVYTIVNSKLPSVFDHGRVWLYRSGLDEKVMAEAAERLVGERDFSSFRASGCAAKSPVRTLMRADVARDDDIISFTFTANGFLKQMVRNIVGTLVEVGRGRIAMNDIDTILNERDRTKAGPCAPPEGLCLVDVAYGTIRSP